MRDISTFLLVFKLGILSLIISLFCCSCANQNPAVNNKKQIALQDPNNIKIYTKMQPQQKKILETIKISKFNNVGVKRQQAIIVDLLKQKASQHGGSAVVILKNGEQEVVGEIIK